MSKKTRNKCAKNKEWMMKKQLPSNAWTRREVLSDKENDKCTTNNRKQNI